MCGRSARPNSSARINEIKIFQRQNIPVVVIDREIPFAAVYPRVMTDNYQAGQLAARQMIAQLGNRGVVALLGLKPGTPSTDAREQGFIDTIRSSNLRLLPSCMWAPIWQKSGSIPIGI